MIDLRDRSNDDPKPWFYAGLFSLATVDEAKRFLAGHSFTVEAIPGLATAVGASASIEDTSADTQAKLTRIREALTQVLDDRPR